MFQRQRQRAATTSPRSRSAAVTRDGFNATAPAQAATSAAPMNALTARAPAACIPTHSAGVDEYGVAGHSAFRSASLHEARVAATYPTSAARKHGNPARKLMDESRHLAVGRPAARVYDGTRPRPAQQNGRGAAPRGPAPRPSRPLGRHSPDVSRS